MMLPQRRRILLTSNIPPSILDASGAITLLTDESIDIPFTVQNGEEVQTLKNIW